MKPVTAIVIGGGARGGTYSRYALDFPDKLKVVGVAEPQEFRRQQIQSMHNIPAEKAFTSWEDVAKLDKFADCVFVTTQDQMHKEPAVAFAKKGYHILLEKPMATTYKDCQAIYQACTDNSTILAVCHVLRYCPQARKLKELIQNGTIGDLVNIQLLEPIGFWHFAHSYVRGNWRNVETSSPSLLAKSCHDIDLIKYWVGDVKCVAVSSFGSLKHFTQDNKPEGAGNRCTECPIEKTCPYSAKKIYLPRQGWPTTRITDIVDIEHVTEAIEKGPYGRCVYECDNNVVDNQVVNMQFEGGVTVSFSMVAFTEKVCGRQAKVFGTKGELSCDFDTNYVRHFDFLTQSAVKHDVSEEMQKSSGSSLRGHGGADFFAMDAFMEAVITSDPSKVLTGPEQSLASHFLTFAAEKARLENCVVNPTVDTDV